MNVLEKLLDIAGLAHLFEPGVDDEKERQAIIHWIDTFIHSIIESVATDIELEKQGMFTPNKNPSQENNGSTSGYIDYVIKDYRGERLQLTQLSLVSCNSIKMTENYQWLKSFSEERGYSLVLKERNIDSDGAEIDATLQHNLDNLDNLDRYFIITLSGW